jgi:hypothetical protein
MVLADLAGHQFAVFRNLYSFQNDLFVFISYSILHVL